MGRSEEAVRHRGRDDMADTIKGARRKLEHTDYMKEQAPQEPEGEPEPGQNLMDEWSVDVSSCRHYLTRREVEIIILDLKKGKSPGPDGVPGELLKRHAYLLSKIFCEAWEELSEGNWTQEMEEVLGRKAWLAIPKTEGVNRTEKLRDIGLGNTCRRVLSRMLYDILHEVGVHELHDAQQAFLQSRDILQNTTKLLRFFGDAVAENGEKKEEGGNEKNAKNQRGEKEEEQAIEKGKKAKGGKKGTGEGRKEEEKGKKGKKGKKGEKGEKGSGKEEAGKKTWRRKGRNPKDKRYISFDHVTFGLFEGIQQNKNRLDNKMHGKSRIPNKHHKHHERAPGPLTDTHAQWKRKRDPRNGLWTQSRMRSSLNVIHYSSRPID